MPKPKFTPYQRIVKAATEGKGVTLSAEEAWLLASNASLANAADMETPETRELFRSTFVPVNRTEKDQPEGK